MFKTCIACILFAFLFIQFSYGQQPEAFTGVWTGNVIRNNNSVGRCKVSISSIHSVQTFGTSGIGKCTIEIELFDMVDNQRNSKQNIAGEYLRSGDAKNTEQVSFKISVPDVEYKQLIKGEINFAFEATGGQIALTGTFYPGNIFSKKNFGVEKWVLSKSTQAHLSSMPGNNLNRGIVVANEVQDFRENYAIVRRGDLFAMIDTNNKIVIDYGKYSFSNGLEYNRVNGFWAQHFIGDIFGFKYGYSVVKHPKTGLYGYINQKGELQIPCMFKEAYPLERDGYALVQYILPEGGKKYLYLDMEGNTLDAVDNYRDYKFNEGVALTDKGFVNRKGELLFNKDFYQGSFFSEGLAAVSKKNAGGQIIWGFVDKTGKLVIPYKYSRQPGPFRDGLSFVRSEQKDEYAGYYIDKQGVVSFYVKPSQITSNSKSNFRAELIKSFYDYYDNFSQQRLSDFESSFYNGIAIWGDGFFYNKSGELSNLIYKKDFVNNEKYKTISILKIHPGYIMAKVNDKTGLYDYSGNLLINKEYKVWLNIDDSSGYALGWHDNDRVIINRRGDVVYTINEPTIADPTPKPVVPAQSPEAYISFNSNHTGVIRKGSFYGRDNKSAENKNFIKAAPDNEMEADYFTVDIDGEKLKITATGKVSMRHKSGKISNASLNIKTGNAITNLYVMKYSTDMILGYEESDGEDTYTYIARLSFATGRIKWKTNIPGFNLKVSLGSKDQQPFVYITTYGFIGKLNPDTGKLIK